MKIDLIGGSGFIGTRFCKSLPLKMLSKILIIDKKTSVDFPNITKQVDVRNIHELRNSIRMNSIIINLAAEHQDNVSPKALYYDVNVTGAKNICTVAVEKNIKKIIFTSSVAVYGFVNTYTDENGKILPFNDYGKSKFQAEEVYRSWQKEDPINRTLVIIRPTVVFGEQNRGNVYNLFKQVATGNFFMIGSGLNKKSIAYVGNLTAFIKYSLLLKSGIHLFNYSDKPDLSMNELVSIIDKSLKKTRVKNIRIPYLFAIFIGYIFDIIAYLFSRKFTISSIRIRKFCCDSIYQSAISSTQFTRPFKLKAAIRKTLLYEFKTKKRKKGR